MGGVLSSGEPNCHYQDVCLGQKVTVTIRPQYLGSDQMKCCVIQRTNHYCVGSCGSECQSVLMKVDE
jgi:hypothetical protein